MIKRVIVDALMFVLLFVAVFAAAFVSLRAENNRVKRECTALFNTAPTAHDSLIVLIDVPNCRTLLSK